VHVKSSAVHRKKSDKKEYKRLLEERQIDRKEERLLSNIPPLPFPPSNYKEVSSGETLSSDDPLVEFARKSNRASSSLSLSRNSSNIVFPLPSVDRTVISEWIFFLFEKRDQRKFGTEYRVTQDKRVSISKK